MVTPSQLCRAWCRLLSCPRGSSPIARTKFNLPFNFAGTAAHITTLVATSVAFFTNADRDTRERAFASATTRCAGSGSLAVTFRAQKSVWHLAHSRLFGTNATTSAADFREPACQMPYPSLLTHHRYPFVPWSIALVKSVRVVVAPVRSASVRSAPVRSA